MHSKGMSWVLYCKGLISTSNFLVPHTVLNRVPGREFESHFDTLFSGHYGRYTFNHADIIW